jgi:hypothetical protein
MTIRVAEVDGAIVGFAWVGPGEGREGEVPPRDRLLYAIYVLRRSTGRVSVRRCSTSARHRTRDAVGREGEPAATAFYLRNGFRFDGVEQIDPQAPLITDARMVR